MNILKNKKSSAISAGIGYTIGNLFVKGIGFLTLPLFSRIMSAEQFGVYNVFLSYDAIIFVIVGMALHSSIRSANYQFKDRINEYTSSISIIYVLNLLLLLVIALLFREPLADILQFSPLIILMLVIHSFGNAIITLYNNRISLEYSYKKYILVALVNSCGNILLSILLMFTFFNENRDLGRIFGTTIVIFGIAVYILLSFYKKAKPKYNKEYWTFGIKYSLPIIPHGISQVLLSQFDRIMIGKIVNNTAAGIYSLSGNIKLILTIITDSISASWSTWFYEEMTRKRTTNIVKNAKKLCILFLILSIGVMSVSPELILLLGGSEYQMGRYVAIPMVIDAFILFLYNIIVPSEYYVQKTFYIMMGTIMAAIINVITNYIFISKYGFLMAAYTTLFSYLCYLILHIIISYKMIHFYVIPIKWIILSLFIVSVVALYDLIFINNIFMRYIICGVVLTPITYKMIRMQKGN